MNISAVDHSEPLGGFRRFEAHRDGVSFNVVAVWTAAPKYRQAHEGVMRHAEWMRMRPTVVLGDFNDNSSFRSRRWQDLMLFFEPLGLISAYHEFFAEPFGRESRPTHFHGGKADRTFHIDYCFIPNAWASRLKNVEVGAFSDWKAVSDHVPIVVDLEV